MGTSFVTYILTTLVALVPAPREDDDATVFETPITYAAGDQLYIDAGTDDALAVGAEGVVRRGESEVARVRVRSASSSSSSLEIVRRFAAEGPRVGDRVVFRIAKPAPETTDDGTSPPAKKKDEPFVPLLAPTEPLAAKTGTSNVFHGWLEVGAGANLSDVDDRDETRFRLSTGGSLDRIAGGAWSAEWDVDWYQRGGDDADDPTEGEVEIDRFVLRYHFGDDGVVGIGRIQPLALPSVGRIDGIYGEVRATQGLRFGVVGGTRPDLEDQGFSSDEYAVAPYAVFEAGSYDDVRLWTSAGFLATWYDGESDRQALLLDARVDLAKRYVVRVTSEVDFYDSDDVARSGTRVTRLGAYASADFHDLFQPWVDVRDIELPDTLARRSIQVDPDQPFDDGYRRTSIGVRHELGQGWSLEESVARTDADNIDDDATFRVRAAKSGLFGLRGSRADLAVYEILGIDSDGIGASGSVSLMPAESLWLRLGYVHSEIDTDTAGNPSFSTKTATFDFDWFLTNDLSLSSRLAHAFGDEDDASLLDVSLTWRW